MSIRAAVFAHIQTWRPYTLCYPGLVGLAGAALATPDRPGPLLAAWAVPTLGWLGAHYLGDYFDRDLDAIDKPHRPIPSGRLSPPVALGSGIAAAVALVLLGALVNWRALLLVAAALAGIVGYSTIFKAKGASGNVLRGALTALALLCGGMTGKPWPPWCLLPVALVFGVHDTASNLVGTVRDVRGDREGGYRTVPVRYGSATAVRIAAALYVIAILVAAADSVLFTTYRTACIALLAVACVLGGIAFVPLVRAGATVGRRPALRAHEVLVAERLVLAAAVVAGGLGIGIALALLAPMLLGSVAVQAVMRSRYEFGPPVPSGAGNQSKGGVRS